LTGFYMTDRLGLWDRFRSGEFWWMHAMVGVWLLFTIILFLAEPLVLDRWFHEQAAADAAFAWVQRAHWLLLVINLITILAAGFDPLTWHIHEMLFGFVMAVVAGFLLTAIPNWTGRPPVSGGLLASLAGLWLLGRIACLASAFVSPWLAVAADLSFPMALAGVVAHEIVVVRNWRNLPIVAAVSIFGIANLLMHLESVGIAVPAGLGWRLGLTAAIVLISVVAGRIVPSFTRNRLVKREDTNLPAQHGWVDRAALCTLHAGLLGWAFFPIVRGFGVLLLLGAVLNLWRLLRWRGSATIAEPLLLILHIGYAWVVLGAALLGLAMLDPDLPQSAAIHALTAGAIGTMTLAVMTRATRGHTGRALSADRTTVAIYFLVNIAALVRSPPLSAGPGPCRFLSRRRSYGSAPLRSSSSRTVQWRFSRPERAGFGKAINVVASTGWPRGRTLRGIAQLAGVLLSRVKRPSDFCECGCAPGNHLRRKRWLWRSARCWQRYAVGAKPADFPIRSGSIQRETIPVFISATPLRAAFQ
jgi:uncharacterized protein involved in response to NO